jgi:hypothetical protein
MGMIEEIRPEGKCRTSKRWKSMKKLRRMKWMSEKKRRRNK